MSVAGAEGECGEMKPKSSKGQIAQGMAGPDISFVLICV